jgi:PAS domain S-box-containing protein
MGEGTAEALGKPFGSYLHPEDVSAWQAFLDQILHSTALDLDCRAMLQDGSSRWLSVKGSAVLGPGDTALGSLIILRDITHRKALEQALSANEERLRLALDAAQVGVFDWDIDHGRIAWSRRHEQLWGFNPQEFGGTFEAFAQRVHLDDLPALNTEIARSIASHELFTQEFRVVWPDGSVRWIAGSGQFEFDATGQAKRMRGVVLDVTARKEAEQALRESEAGFQICSNRPSTVFCWSLRITASWTRTPPHWPCSVTATRNCCASTRATFSRTPNMSASTARYPS